MWRSCSNLTPGCRNLIRLGNGLLLSCPRPPPEGQASATKTRDVTSRRRRKKSSSSKSSPPTFVTFWWERHKTPPQTPPRPLFWALVTPGQSHARLSAEAGAQVERRAAGGRASEPLRSARWARKARNAWRLRDIIVRLSTYTTCSAVATPREAGRARSVPVRVLFCGGQGGRCGVGKNVNLIKPPCRSFRYR